MYVCMYLFVTYYRCPIHRPHNHQPVCPDKYTQPKFQLYVYGYKLYSSLQLMIYFFCWFVHSKSNFFWNDREWIYFRVVITYSSSTPWCQSSLVLFLWVSSKKLKLLMSLGLWIVRIEIVSFVHCFMQAPAARHCRSTLSRKKKTFYLTYIYISILVYGLCAIIAYIICCLPTPKCRHTQSYPLLPLSHWALTSSTNHGSLAEQNSKVVFVISLPNFIETEHKKQIESGKENERVQMSSEL